MSIKLFKDANFSGASQDFGIGFYNLEDWGFSIVGTAAGIYDSLVQNDELSSYILAPATSVTFYEHIDKGGANFVDVNHGSEEKRIGYIGNEWNDRISSIVVEPVYPFGEQPAPLDTQANLNGVLVFEDWRFNQESDRSLGIFDRVRSQQFDSGDYNLPYEPSIFVRDNPVHVFGVRPKTISSIKVGSGYYVEIFDEENFKGNMLTIVESTSDIRVLRKEHYNVTSVEQAKIWNDRAMSLKVRNNAPR
jgi:hypothetical protein